MNTVINIDLDFFFTPALFANYFGSTNNMSPNDYKARAQQWLTISDFLQKTKIERRPGKFVMSNNEMLFSIKNRITKKLMDEEFKFVSIDAHHNLYNWHELDYYKNRKLSEYKAYDCNISIFKDFKCKEFEWIVPDHYTATDIKQHFDFKMNCMSLSNKSLIVNAFDKLITINLKTLSELELTDVVFINVVTNKNLLNIKEEDLKLLFKVVSQR